MNAKSRVDAFERTVGNHGRSALADFFGGLEAEHHGARETVAKVVQNLPGGEQHGDVAVVAAGMHEAFVLARVFKARLFRHFEAVDVAAKENRAARTGALDRGERARGHAAFAPGNAHLVEFRADELGGFEFLGARFGAGVKEPAHPDLVVGVLRFEVEKIHFHSILQKKRDARRRASRNEGYKRFTKRPAMMTDVIVTVEKPPTIIEGNMWAMRYSRSSSVAAISLHIDSVMIALKGKP